MAKIVFYRFDYNAISLGCCYRKTILEISHLPSPPPRRYYDF